MAILLRLIVGALASLHIKLNKAAAWNRVQSPSKPTWQYFCASSRVHSPSQRAGLAELIYCNPKPQHRHTRNLYKKKAELPTWQYFCASSWVHSILEVGLDMGMMMGRSFSCPISLHGNHGATVLVLREMEAGKEGRWNWTWAW